jgi:VIT1/CCC1 family predicted Fe2+/Mn2+ transporter
MIRALNLPWSRQNPRIALNVGKRLGAWRLALAFQVGGGHDHTPGAAPHLALQKVRCVKDARASGVRWSAMARAPFHNERHLMVRIGWLRAAVLGANDGIVSTASLIVGVAAAHAAKGEVLLAGAAGLVAGAMSMAAGEYVSVSSQSDTERADLARETAELAGNPAAERLELTNIYIARGVAPALAEQVAMQLMAKDAIGVHAREELGISDVTTARPIQAALTSAGTFSVGAFLPLAVVIFAPVSWALVGTACAALMSLALLGAVGARAGGAGVLRAVVRVTFWGAIAMGVTAGIGRLFGAVV